ncbi:Outer membrane protein A precursor [Minicystis rosea]|nr:Outer membrane protein A precursor [Minicystis rosea]
MHSVSRAHLPQSRGGARPAQRRGRALFSFGFSSVAALVAFAAAPSSARAQTATFAVDRLTMAGAPGDGITVWRPEMSEKTRFFGQLGLGLAVNPLRADNYVDNLDNEKKLKNPLTTQFITYANVGVELLSRVSLQVAFPLVAYQAGNPTNNTMVNLAQPSVDLNHVAPGDLRVEGRVIVVRTEDRSFKLGLNAAALIPTGNKYSFAGDGGFGASFGLAAEYDARAVIVALNAAYRLRPSVVLNELVVGSELTYGLGVWVPLRKGTIRLGAEIFGGVGASPSKRTVFTTPQTTRSNVGDLDTTPLEWLLNGRMYFTAKRQVYAGLGAGSRLTGGYAPDFRTVAVVGGSFSVSDSDPGSPGARYVFETRDTADADKDGIPDEVDACPNEPGELDSDPEKIGCPRYIRRVKGSNEIEVLKRIEFEFDKSTILPVSYPILDEMVSLLHANPTIKSVSIEGHTDNQGTPEYNQHLSEDRANAVMAYLVKKGIAQGRLTAKGFGLTKPRATNDTDDGRQKNRRVEFHITEQIGEGPKKP